MAKQGKSTATPKLRFPEFRKSAGWEITQLSKAFLRITNGKANSQDHEDGGIYPLFDRSEVIKASSHFAYSAEAVILPGEGMSFRPRYFDGRFNLHQRAYALMDCQGHTKYFYYALDHAKDDLALRAVKSTVLSLRLPIIENFVVYAPERREQQMIADCLTLLDEVIVNQGRKVETLKTHKRGLMQQLFPVEGETKPKLRFREFRDARDWQKRTLGQLGELVSGLTYSPDDIRDEGLLVLRSSNVQDGIIALESNVFVRPDIKGANLSKPNDILICVRNGSKSLIGKNALIPEEMPLCTHGAFMTVFRSQSAKFVFQLFQTKTYEDQVAADLGATINSINGNQLRKYEFYVPEPAEQLKIAACLSSVDTRIAAESDHLATLKAHKLGLMQQLFPASMGG